MIDRIEGDAKICAPESNKQLHPMNSVTMHQTERRFHWSTFVALPEFLKVLLFKVLRYRSLNVVVYSGILLAVLMPVLSLGLLQGREQLYASSVREAHHLQALSGFLIRDFGRELHEVGSRLHTLSASHVLQISQNDVVSVLNRHVTENSNIELLLLVDPDGTVAAINSCDYTGKPIPSVQFVGTRLSGVSWIEALKQASPANSRPYFAELQMDSMVSKVSGGMGNVFSIATPLFDEQGMLRHVLCAKVSPKNILSQVLASIPSAERSGDLRIDFVSAAAQRLDGAAASEGEVKGLLECHERLGIKNLSEEIAEIVLEDGRPAGAWKSVGMGAWSSFVKPDVQWGLVALGATPSDWTNGADNLHWSAVVSIKLSSVSNLVALSDFLTKRILLWGIGSSLIALLCAHVLCRWTLASMSKVGLVLEELGKGNLIARMNATGSLSESSVLAGKLNGAMEGICDSICNVSNRLGALEWAAGELVTSGGLLADNARETSEIAESTALSSAGVSANVTGVAAATEQMSGSIKEVARNASEASRVAQNAVESASSAQQAVSRLGESSKEISSVVSVIREIAEQTSLLALNAAIEAARAGEEGKGFAVVANEVKDLAKGTTVAIGEIEAKVFALQSDCNGVIGVLSGINDIIVNINDLQSSIAGAVAEQNASVHSISHNLVEASSGVTKISENINAVATAATQTLQRAESVKDAAGNVSLYTKEMQDSLVAYTFQ